MSGKADELVDLYVTFHRASERAILVKDEAGTEAWLALSLIEMEGRMEPGRVVEVTAPRWLIEEKGLEA